MKKGAAGKGGTRRRIRRAERAAAGLEEILSDAVHTQTRSIVTGFTDQATTTARSAALVATGGELPTPPIPQWHLLWDAAMWAVTLDEAEMWVTGFIVDELAAGFGIRVTAEQPLVRGMAAIHIAAIDDWSQDFKAAVGRVIDRGHKDLMSIPQVADALADAGAATGRQATLIARTETVAASNAASYRGAEAFAQPGDTKVWVATTDSRTRDDHKQADGQRVPIGQPFIVGGERTDYPGGASLSPAQRANCRCTWIWEPAD